MTAFPDWFSDSSQMNYYEQIKRKSLAYIDYVLRFNKEALKIIRDVDIYLMNHMKPKRFSSEDKENVILQHDNAFENLCIALEQSGIQQPKKLTVFEFYKRLKYIEKQNKKHGKLK